MRRRSFGLGGLSFLVPPAWSEPTGPEAALWASVFQRPEGGELRLADLRGQKLLINFWATWCAPCVRELPLLSDFARQNRDWRVLGLAIDGPTPVREFLKTRPVGFEIGLAGLNGAELGRTLGNRTGGLPFSVALTRAGRLVWRHAGETRASDLQALLRRPEFKG
jgi:thiol-disulfide isomerase/thioredoxin